MKHTTPEKLEAFIRDAAAYINVSEESGQKDEITLHVLAHDIKGLANDEPCLVPRVTGYSEVNKI